MGNFFYERLVDCNVKKDVDELFNRAKRTIAI